MKLRLSRRPVNSALPEARGIIGMADDVIGRVAAVFDASQQSRLSSNCFMSVLSKGGCDAGICFAETCPQGGIMNKEKGAIGYILMWLMGVPATVLFLIFLLRGCN